MNVDNITLSQLKVLEEVFHQAHFHGKGIMLKELAARLNVSPSAASQTVETLVREEILLRRPAESDRRAVEISPAQHLLEAGEGDVREFGAIFDGILGEEELDVFFRVVGKMSAVLEEKAKEEKK